MNLKHGILSPNIRSFEQAALAAFDFLRRYGFHHTETIVLLPDIEVRFRNSTTEITALFVIGSPLDVGLGRLANVGGEVRNVEGYSMSFLLLDQAPTERVTLVCELGDARLPAILQQLASLLEKYAQDVLEGDFSMFPRLQAVAYREAAIHELQALQRYGLILFETDISLPDLHVRFRNDTTEVTIACRIGSRRRVELGRLAPVDGGKEVVESYDFDALLKERAPDEVRQPRWDDPVEPNIPFAVHGLASQLERYALDVLNGDFSALATTQRDNGQGAMRS